MSFISKLLQLLPSYPISNDLLLINVSINELTEDQLLQRQCYGYYPLIPLANHDEDWIETLSQRWNIHPNVLKSNFHKMSTLINQSAQKRMYHFSTNAPEEYVHEHEYKIALEFYLQIDYDLFYMKTCSYRGAQPVMNQPQSIFSTDQRNPYGRYSMETCRQQSCCLCYTSNRLESQSNVQHIFVNGYRTILNCPATCTTQNIIYVLTCPCKKFDYIGETSLSLPRRLSYHRKHGMRIIKEFLFGKKLTNYINHGQMKSFEELVKDGMRLYQHSCRCSVAMQCFLDENPDYWSFIPQRISEYEEQQQEREIILVDDHQYEFASDIPVPSNINYHFNVQQKRNIEEFFQQKKKNLHPLNPHFHLHEAKIIAVLPENASIGLRRFIESLFITHAQTKLNTLGHLDDENSLTHMECTDELCYENLVRPMT
ncbi:unnamed protein product [Rotaria sp. Silwood2]|nr:unnamed protein product [Rotaria sp. Silwood2]CAF4239719.1 unnamed protein product [Rotaria sp. Silwood2]